MELSSYATFSESFSGGEEISAMRVLTAGICAAVLICSASVDANAIGFFEMGPDGLGGGSWTRHLALAWQGGGGFNEVRLAYRPDLDAGGGAFESPFVDYFRDGGPYPGSADFSGPERFDWSVTDASWSYVQMQGVAIDGSWLPFRVNHSGDGAYMTGFSFARYHNGSFLAAAALEWSQTEGQFLARTEAEWNQDWDWATTVPEPTAFAILGVGLALLGLRRFCGN
jgi:hypothetical protein